MMCNMYIRASFLDAIQARTKRQEAAERLAAL